MESKPRIYLPDGSSVPAIEEKPDITKMEWLDKTLTYTENDEQIRFTPEDILVAAARMLRDGRSLDYIMTELDVDRAIVSHRMLERAIRNVGMPLLEKRIAEGKEAAESRILVDADTLPLRLKEDAN